MATETPDHDGDAGKSTGTLEAVDLDYLHWEPEAATVSIHMHLGAVDGMARDILERLSRQPNNTSEVGGLLLGRLDPGDRPDVWIERYQRIPCAHTFGPKFVLDRDDMEGLEKAASSVLAAGDITVVGFYRSNTRPEFRLEESDFELIRRYFSDPSDLILLVKAQANTELVGQFFTWDTGNGPRAVGGEFPFHGRVVSSDTLSDTPETADDAEVTSVSQPRATVAPPRELPRRIVPDFTPPVEPSPSLYGLSGGSPAWPSPPEPEEPNSGLKKWLPIVAALLVVAGITWLIMHQQKPRIANPAPAQVAETGRPLGLAVDSSGSPWRVLWNPNATALHDARTVQLFIREGDEQTRVELPPSELISGSYPYKPLTNDVTFRLEVVDHAGQVSAESFRLLRQATPTPGSPPPPVQVPPAEAVAKPAPPPAEPPRVVPPKATYRAPPVVAAGVRPRIQGTVAIDVKVHIDTHGRVTSASPITKRRSGIEDYLASRAVAAARLWKFEPARENGVAVPGTQTLHFVFNR